MTVLSVIGIWLALSLPFALLVGRILKNCSTFDSDALSAIDSADEEFPINRGA